MPKRFDGGNDGELTTLLTLKEVANLLRLSPQTVYKMLDGGEIPAIKVGSQWRFDPKEIQTWLAGQRTEPGVNN